jgi:hypothetical protein
MGSIDRIGGVQRPPADRTVFQGGKAESENKTILRKLKKRGNDTNLDSAHSVSVVLSFEGANKKHGDVIYQFYLCYQDDVVSKAQSF